MSRMSERGLWTLCPLVLLLSVSMLYGACEARLDVQGSVTTPVPVRAANLLADGSDPSSTITEVPASSLLPEIEPNTWVKANLTFVKPPGYEAASWTTTDGYSGSIYRSATGTVLWRTGLTLSSAGINPGFYGNVTLEWNPASDEVHVATIADGWGGGSYGGGALLPPFFVNPMPSPRHTYDGFAYVDTEDAFYLMLGANWRIGSDATPEAAEQLEIDNNSTWRYTFSDGLWTRYDHNVRTIGFTGSSYESHLRYWPQGNRLIFLNDEGNYYAEFDLTQRQWTRVTLANSRPMSLYNARSAWDSKRQLWVFRLGSKVCTFDPAERRFASLPEPYSGGAASKGVVYIPKYDVYLLTGETGNDTWVYHIEQGAWTNVPGGSASLPNGYPQYDPNTDLVCLVYQHDVWRFRYVEVDDATPPEAPQNVQATGTSLTSIQLSWDASTDPESGVAYYKVYRDNVLVAANVKQTSYTDTDLTEATTYTYEVTAVNGAFLESARSSPAVATTLADTTPPTIESVTAVGPSTQVKVVFTEPVDPTSAQDPANYVIDAPTTITVTGASLASDGKTVTLTTAPMTNGVTYTLKVSNVTDRARTPNPIAPDTQVQFTHIAAILLVDFGPSAGTDIYGLEGWNTTIKDTYTANHAAGPGGMAVSVGGSDGSYNFQGVTSSTPRTFVAGEKIVVTWYNNHATSSYTFTPRISFDDPNRPPSNYPPVGTWHSMTPLTLAPGQTGTTEFVFDAVSAGNYSLVNVNANYTFSTAYTMVCDKIELIGITPLLGDIDGDGHVNVFDVFIIAEAWNTQVGDPNFNPACDLDGDGFVNVFDIFVLAENWNT